MPRNNTTRSAFCSPTLPRFEFLVSEVLDFNYLEVKWRTNGPKPEPFSSTFYLIIIPEETMQPLYKDKAFVHQKYVVEGLSIKEIAHEIFSSKEAVRSALRRFDIPVREAHKPHSGRVSCPSYGTKLRSGRASPHVAEQQMIETIKELRAQGLTLRKVAEILTNMGVPTKKRGKSWHPEMVKRVLDRCGSGELKAN